MRKLWLGWIYILTITVSAQRPMKDAYVDDGLISKIVPSPNTNDSIAAYMKAFYSSIDKARNATLATRQDVVRFLQFDPANVSTLEQMLADRQSCRSCAISGNLIKSLILLRDKSIHEDYTLGQIRQSLKDIVTKGGWNASELNALLFIDLTLQNEGNAFNVDARQTTLPHWFTCGVGIVAGVIIGGINGVIHGIELGTMISGPPGAVVGGAIGGLIGAAAGAVAAAIAGC